MFDMLFNSEKRKIHNELPNYHPQTGQHLEWEIFISPDVKGYNSDNGKPIYKGKPKIKITQKTPKQLCDRNVYYYDWKSKRIVQRVGMSWL